MDTVAIWAPRTSPEPSLEMDFAGCCWPGCSSPPVEPPGMPICRTHVLAAFGYCQDLIAQAPVSEIRNLGLSATAMEAGPLLRSLARKARSVVYYAMVDGYVKIGTTVHLDLRMDQLGGNLITTEPGNRALEAQRHREFAHLLAKGREYFLPGSDLMGHIVKLQSVDAMRYRSRREASFPQVGGLALLWRQTDYGRVTPNARHAPTASATRAASAISADTTGPPT